MSVSHDFKTHKWASKTSKFGKKSKILPKSSQINKIRVGFCDNSIDRSLVLVLKHVVCKFYGCASVFKETMIFWRNFFLQNIIVSLKTLVQPNNSQTTYFSIKTKDLWWFGQNFRFFAKFFFFFKFNLWVFEIVGNRQNN